jgi:hypothetical protein
MNLFIVIYNEYNIYFLLKYNFANSIFYAIDKSKVFLYFKNAY